MPHNRSRSRRVRVIAHRGASAYAPENTLAAFRLAVAMEPVWLELDCRLTKDSEVVVIHDESVDRTTDGRGNVAEMALAELRRLDAGSWKSSAFRGERVPTLGETLDFAKGRIGVYIEIKSCAADTGLLGGLRERIVKQSVLGEGLCGELVRIVEGAGTRNLEITRKVIALIRERRMEHEVVLQSFSPIVGLVARYEAPEIRLEFLGSAGSDDSEEWENYLRWGRLLGAAGFNVDQEGLTPSRLAAFHAAGKTVAVWVVDDEEDMRRYADWGVDGIITNRPDLCLAVISE